MSAQCFLRRYLVYHLYLLRAAETYDFYPVKILIYELLELTYQDLSSPHDLEQDWESVCSGEQVANDIKKTITIS